MSKYSAAVEADSPLAYWKLLKNSGAENKGGTGITLSGTSSAEPGPVSGEVGATSWDGTNDAGSVALNLSGQSSITLEYWSLWDNNANDDDLAFEYSPNYNSNKAFIVDPNAGGGAFEFGFHGEGGFQYWIDSFPRPSEDVWHHIVLQMDRVNRVNKAYVDSVEQTLSTVNHSAGGSLGAFGNHTLYLMCRNAASLFAAGDLAHVAFYSGALSKARVEAHYTAASEEEGGGEAVYEESGNGSITMAGSLSEALEVTEAAEGSIGASGAATESGEAVEAASGTITVSGTAALDEWGWEEAANGTIELTGSISEALEFLDSVQGAITISGTASDLAEFIEAASGEDRLIGVFEETFETEGEEEGERLTYIIQPLGVHHRTTQEPSDEELGFFARLLNFFRS